MLTEKTLEAALGLREDIEQYHQNDKDMLLDIMADMEPLYLAVQVALKDTPQWNHMVRLSLRCGQISQYSLDALIYNVRCVLADTRTDKPHLKIPIPTTLEEWTAAIVREFCLNVDACPPIEIVQCPPRKFKKRKRRK